MDSEIMATPAEKFNSVCSMFDVLTYYIYSIDTPFLFHDSEDRERRMLARCIGRLIQICVQASNLATSIEKSDEKLCPHLALIATKRAQRQIRWHQEGQTTCNAAAEPSFPRFLELPVEIQLMVWEIVAQPLYCQNVAAIRQTAFIPERSLAGRSLVPIPFHIDPVSLLLRDDDVFALRSVCHLSREVYKRFDAKVHEYVSTANNYRMPSFGSCPSHVSQRRLEKQRSRYARLNELVFNYQDEMKALISSIRYSYLFANYNYSKQQEKPQQMTNEEADNTSQTLQREHGLEYIIEELFGSDINDPINIASGGSVVDSLRRLRPEFRVGYLLGISPPQKYALDAARYQKWLLME